MTRDESLDKKLRFAISNRRLIRVVYDSAMRTGEPHDYGMLGGAPKLLFYQLRRSGSDAPPRKRASGWRLLELAKIEACVVSAKKFPGSRGAAHTQHIAWDKLFARVGGTIDAHPRTRPR